MKTYREKKSLEVRLVQEYPDLYAMSSLVEDYFNILEAPHKELIWLEGGHGLDGENVGQFVDGMVNTVLPQTLPLQ